MSKIHSVGLPEEQYRKLRQLAHDQDRSRQECLAEAVDLWALGPLAPAPGLRDALNALLGCSAAGVIAAASDVDTAYRLALEGAKESPTETRARLHRELAELDRVELDPERVSGATLIEFEEEGPEWY